jgi:hypothetical protein
MNSSLVRQPIFEQMPTSRAGVPESVLKRITPEMSRDALQPPIVQPSMARIDLACGRVTETITLIKIKGVDGKLRPLIKVGSPAYAVSVALEQKGAHLGLTWAEIGRQLGEDPTRVRGKANIRNAAARVTEVWERSHGVLVKWDFEGRFRLVRDNERARHGNWFMKFLKGTFTTARRQIWGRLPETDNQLVQQIPIFPELEDEKRHAELTR